MDGSRSVSTAKVHDERLARFLARHAVPEREAVARDVAELKGRSPEATWPIIDAVCRSVADVLSMRPDRLAVMAEEDPPHPSHAAVMARLRALYKNPRP